MRKFEFVHDKDLKCLPNPVRTNIIHLSGKILTCEIENVMLPFRVFKHERQ